MSRAAGSTARQCAPLPRSDTSTTHASPFSSSRAIPFPVATYNRAMSVRKQQELAGRAARLEVFVRAPGLLERVTAAYAHVERAVGDPAEDLGGPRQQLLAFGGVVPQRRAREEERASVLEPHRVDRRHGPARRAVEHHRPPRAQ